MNYESIETQIAVTLYRHNYKKIEDYIKSKEAEGFILQSTNMNPITDSVVVVLNKLEPFNK